ncbi:MAG: extracellular solute-binding protein [Clostridiales bacterium]|jgi:putative aldouronate transport system substrate-binding protein|nr:extracellular solute-binding protein [Clostridiales bacterium]
MKKAFAFFLAILSACSLVACSKSESPAAPAAPTAGAAQQAAPQESAGGNVLDENGRIVKFDPPIDMTWAVTTSAVMQFKNGDTYDNNIWSRKYLEDHGINLKVAFTADGTSGAYNDKLNMQLASGDLPDIVHSYQYDLFKNAYNAGYVKDITDTYAQYASDYLLECQQKYPGSFDYVSFDGRLHGISFFNDNRAGGTLLWIRDDWLENLGLSAPKTIDELYDLAYAFTFNDPDGNGVADTFGLGINKDLITDYTTIYGLLSGFGVPAEGDGTYFRGADGKMTNAYLQPGVADALGFLNKLYVDGILDPEFTVKDANVMQEDIASGKIGMAFGRQWGTWLPWNLVLEADGVTVHSYPVPVATGYERKVGIGNDAGGEIFFLNSKFKNPEAFVLLCNTFSSVYNMYMTPEVSSIYADDEQYRFSPVVLTEPQEPLWQPVLAEAFRSGNSTDLPARLLNHYTKVSGFESGEMRDSEAYGLWGQYALGASVDICLNVYAKEGNLVQNIIGATQPESQSEYRSLLEDLVKQSFTDVILTGDLSKVDSFRSSWLSIGGQQILDELDALSPAK